MADLGLAVCHTLRHLRICNCGINKRVNRLAICSFLPDERCENITEYEERVCRCQGDEQLVERLSANKQF
jgi:hypothetical protein